MLHVLCCLLSRIHSNVACCHDLLELECRIFYQEDFLHLSCATLFFAQLDTMMRLRTAFAMLCSACMCASLPALDVPREMMKDVNKPPFPTVNIIADQPITDAAQVDQLRGARSAQRSLLERITSAQQHFETSVSVDLDAQNQQLDKLQQMNARIGVLPRGSR